MVVTCGCGVFDDVGLGQTEHPGGVWQLTATFRCADGRTLHLRKATALEPHQKPIYDALGIQPDAGGFVKKVI